jgi:putative membrane protein
MNFRKNYPFYLLILFFIFAIIMGIEPKYRYLWFVENIILLIFIPLMIISYRYFKFSNASYTLIFLFVILQTIGAHFSYAEVPFSFITNLLGFERNNYDRFVHFMFGFLLGFPLREFFIRTSKIENKFYSYFVPIMIGFAFGAIYEILEWIAIITILKPTTTNASLFLGAQGDVWDAQKDMALVGSGFMLSMLITFFKNLRK